MLHELSRMIGERAVNEGITETFLPEVTLFRTNQDLPKAPLIYEQCLCIAVQGHKTCHMNDTTLTYTNNEFLVVPTILPLVVEAFAHGDDPLLAITISLEYHVIKEVMGVVGMGLSSVTEGKNPPAGIYLEPLTADIVGPLIRLMQSLQSKAEAALLGKQVVREIYYRVLTGKNGHILASAARGESSLAKVSEVLRTIHDNYANPMDISDLADSVNMSSRTFHKHFKSVTSCTPVQYLKSIRLEKARQFLVNDGLQASAAAYEVGYESPSQFSREFKRYFGYSPRDAR
ncbi:MAG: AraC family transcriptional regulator N-terminal domain-containing protein [Desulfovibrio sp.]